MKVMSLADCVAMGSSGRCVFRSSEPISDGGAVFYGVELIEKNIDRLKAFIYHERGKVFFSEREVVELSYLEHSSDVTFG